MLTHTIDPTIFRTYDIRGIVGQTLTEANVLILGKAIGSLVREQNENQVIIARDGRHSGVNLSNALCEGLLSVGCKVINIGMVPTPLLYYATTLFEQRSGVMITGSHNPRGYNGLKIVVKGTTLAEDDIQALYQRILENRFYIGQSIVQEFNVIDRYMKDVLENIHLSRPLKIVVDAGNGVGGMIAPQLYRALGCEVHEILCEVDGNFPNHHPDPSQTENLHDLIAAVQHHGADVGLAFDGDADRLGVVTNQGEVIWPDRLLMLFAEQLLTTNPGAKIIFDVKCTNHLGTLIRKLGGEPIMWKTGHSLIKAKLAESKALLAGEMSGHFFFKDRWFGFDDALYAGARLLEILSQRQADSASVFNSIPNSINTPELKILVAEEEKNQVMQKLIERADLTGAHEIITIDGLRVNFTDGWGLVRPSNTTPYLILRFEAINMTILEKIQSVFRDWILTVKPDLVLPF